uniref:Uncharacterized protein n=1 Tax=Rhizophora mucronata TaxID=61149 RepID=A0A2P2PTR0_RHIMU
MALFKLASSSPVLSLLFLHNIHCGVCTQNFAFSFFCHLGLGFNPSLASYTCNA